MRIHGWIAAVAAAALAAPAAAQQGGGDGKAGGPGKKSTTTNSFEQACIDLIHGRMPTSGGPKAITALKTACAGLIDSRTEAPLHAAEQQRARQELQAAEGGAQGQPKAGAQAGQSSAQSQQGQGVLASFEQAGRELVNNPGAAIGMTRGGPVVNTLISNPIGYFTGLGFNVEYFRALIPKVNWSAGARYSKTDASNGTATTFGVMGGADWFMIGRNNEGLRIGPRVELALGRENFEGSTTFARMGLSGEVGYNFISTRGLTGLLAVGLGGRVAGDSANDNFESFTGGEFGPYMKLGLGYSW
jgi:hypothetical protein